MQGGGEDAVAGVEKPDGEDSTDGNRGELASCANLAGYQQERNKCKNLLTAQRFVEGRVLGYTYDSPGHLDGSQLMAAIVGLGGS